MHSAQFTVTERQDNRRWTKTTTKKKRFTSIVEKQFTPLLPFFFFYRNTAALSAVNTLCVNLFVFARQCSVAASGACLQSNSLSPLFLCFLSVLSDRRQGWGMSATSSCTGVCWCWSLLAHVELSLFLSITKSASWCENTEAEMIFFFQIFDHHLNTVWFMNII